MLAVSGLEGARLVPLIRYRDVGAAIGWLGRAFAFEKHLVVTADDGRIVYAQLKYGDALVMLSPVEGSGLDGIFKQPDEIGGAATQCCYLVVPDVEAHRARATAAGAEIVLTQDAETDPRRGYSCRDLEGHIWSFGTFDPWQNASPKEAAPARIAGRPRRRVLPTLALLAVLFAAGAATVAIDPAARELYEKVTGEIVALVQPLIQPEPVAPQPVAAARSTAGADGAPADAGPETAATAQQLAVIERLLALQKGAREAAESAARKLSDQLGKERLDKESTAKTLESARQQLAIERAAKDSAERKAREASDKLARSERISESWMLRAEQAEAKAQAAEADIVGSRPSEIETGSPPPEKSSYQGAAAPSAKPGLAAVVPAKTEIEPLPAPATVPTTVPATMPPPASPAVAAAPAAASPQGVAEPLPAKPAAKAAQKPRPSRSKSAKGKSSASQDTKSWTFGPW